MIRPMVLLSSYYIYLMCANINFILAGNQETSFTHTHTVDTTAKTFRTRVKTSEKLRSRFCRFWVLAILNILVEMDRLEYSYFVLFRFLFCFFLGGG